MRPLTEEESVLVFQKLSKYIGENTKQLLERPDGTYVFRLHRNRIFYVKEDIMKLAGNVARENLVSFGTCFGKITKSGKFHLHVTALDFLAPYALNKIWLRPSAEQQFLYGHHVTKAGLGRMTENTKQYDGVVLYNMNDLPLGFGVAAKSTQECRHTDPTAIVAFHQADVGEYLRSEQHLL